MTDTKKSEYDMAEEVRSFNILMEEMRSGVQLLAEGIVGLSEQMDRRFEESDKRYEAIDKRIIGLASELFGIKDDVKDVKELAATLNTKFDRLEANVEHYDKDIASLKRVVGLSS